MNEEIDETPGFSRRDMLRKTAIVGGALVWTAPAVQSLAGPAFAQTVGSPRGAEVCTYYAVSLTITNATGGFTCADISGSTASGSTDCVSNPPPSASNFPAAVPGGCPFVSGAQRPHMRPFGRTRFRQSRACPAQQLGGIVTGHTFNNPDPTPE